MGEFSGLMDFVNKKTSEYRQAMMKNMSSTLVETVSIDYEDFNESFLTCGTCLCMYDGTEHYPKLLPCSHTVCLQCLDRIVATFARDTGQFRCPICRELITIPRGGVSALPPSFLVNQLLDLMARQRREVIPKCSTHQTQELLFCETCDTVFCTLCTGGTHKSSLVTSTGSPTHSGGTDSGNNSPIHQNNASSTADHTVIPFSIAIKRMSEILIYKANECTAKLDAATEIVNAEIHRLDHNADSAFEQVNARFQAAIEAIEAQRQKVLSEVKRKKDEKKKVLDDQLGIIKAEKTKVDSDVKAMEHHVEVRNITKKISDLNCKLDTVSTLSEPRENSYIEYLVVERSTGESHGQAFDQKLNELVLELGQIKTSKTFPSLCRVTMDTAIANLEMVARLTTINYEGETQSQGGDPVSALVVDDKGERVPTDVKDKDDGTYEIKFTAHRPGTYCLKVLIFDRPVKDCPLFFDVTDHNPPLISFGSRGGAKEKGFFMQPCNVTVDDLGQVYVVDTGNSRIKKLTSNLDFIDHVTNEGLEGRSTTGICMGSSRDSLMVINWRTKMVTEMTLDGNTIGSFSHEDLREPIDIALDLDDNVVIADNGIGSVLVFETSGKLLKTIGSRGNGRGQFKDISAVTVTPSGDILVADSRIQVFSPAGDFVREIYPQGKGKGRYGGLVCDNHGFLLATRTEKARSFIQVFKLDTGSLYSLIDSHGCKMKRPTGLAVMQDRHLVVVDIGNDCVRKYRYF